MVNLPIQTGLAHRFYPEQKEKRPGAVEKAVATLGSIAARWIRPSARRYRLLPKAVAAAQKPLQEMADADLTQAARELSFELHRKKLSPEQVARSFALVRESASRLLGMVHREVQLIGGAVLLDGRVAEMETGEGKTLTATLAASTLALAGIPVHIITVNDYLARRDAEWMRPVYELLGLSVGCVAHGLQHAERRAAYACDVTYCTNKELAFDYLRDRLLLWDRPGPLRLQVERLFGNGSRVGQLVLRGLHFAIVDEADSVLVDEARTPLIISSDQQDAMGPEIYTMALEIARGLESGVDFRVLEGERKVEIRDAGSRRIAGADWRDSAVGLNEEQREEIVRQALTALYLFHKDRHYLVKDNRVQIIDEYTGRLMSDRSWERGLHQLIELKEDCEVTQRRETRARISYQRFFRRYLGLAGMTGTAREVAGELWSVYNLKVVTVPTYRPMKRTQMPDRIFSTVEEKWEAVTRRTAELNKAGRPVLIGTRSVEASEALSACLEKAGLPHRVLNARQNAEEAEIIARAGEAGQITVATNMAGRGTDIILGQGVKEQGGLHVIATERHDAGRIDRQLFGRSGRQGDPGSFEAMVSLEDELTQQHLPAWKRKLVSVIFSVSGGRFPSRWGRRLFQKAQREAERQHSRARRELLRYDEQLSDSLAFSGRIE